MLSWSSSFAFSFSFVEGNSFNLQINDVIISSDCWDHCVVKKLEEIHLQFCWVPVIDLAWLSEMLLHWWIHLILLRLEKVLFQVFKLIPLQNLLCCQCSKGKSFGIMPSSLRTCLDKISCCSHHMTFIELKPFPSVIKI
jgi:hypothetical protein